MTASLVLVHGFMGASVNWSPIVHRLAKSEKAQGWSVTAAELLGHGMRGHDGIRLPLNLDQVADDLLAQLPPGPVVALGHSFGLRPLLRLSVRYPERFRALIAEDSSPVLSENGTSDLHEILGRTPVPFVSRQSAKEYFEKVFGVASPMARFLLSNIRENSQGQHEWRFHHQGLKDLLAEGEKQALWKEWEAFPAPIHMVFGERGFVSKAVLAECQKTRLSKETKLHEIKGSGHWVHADNPDAFVQCLESILQSLG